MCLIPSYTEIEKKNQVVKVLNLIESPINTEAQRQNLLYNLAFMNNMVVKGYMKERTYMDDTIYSVKDVALDYIIKQMPERCFLSYDNGSYVIYICVNSRQYSFHTRSSHGMKYSYELGVREPRWDGIVSGWELSDEEYRKQVENRKNTIAANREKAVAERKQWEREIQLKVIKQIHGLQRNRERVEEFKRTMEERITPAQRRTKTYREYQRNNFHWSDCWKLWGEKWGFGCYPPETFFYAWRCTGGFSDKGAERYAEEYFNKIRSHYNF